MRTLVTAGAAAVMLLLARDARADSCTVEGVEGAYNRVAQHVYDHGNAAEKRAARTAMQAAVRAINNLGATCQRMERRRNSSGAGGHGRPGTVRRQNR